MNNNTILIDMDDTLTWLLPVWVKYLNQKYNLQVNWQDIKEWNVCNYFPSLTREQVYEPLITEEIWDLVTPRDGAVEAVQGLFDSGYEIFICTSTDYRNVRPKYEKVICKYFPFIDWQHFIVASKKQMIHADFIIDDAPHNLVGGCQKHRILMPMPHNEDFKYSDYGIIKIPGWHNAAMYIRFISTREKRDEMRKSLN